VNSAIFLAEAPLDKPINMRGWATNKDTPKVALSQVSLLLSPLASGF
jgi:hypothetical protein